MYDYYIRINPNDFEAYFNKGVTYVNIQGIVLADMGEFN